MLNNYCKIENKIKNAVKYNVFYKDGLNSQQVRQRYKDGLSNKKNRSGLKSYSGIVFKNLFSFLNISLFIVTIILLKYKLYNRLFFLIFFSFNFLINLFNDLKVRKIIGKVSLISNQKITVIRDSTEKVIFFNKLVLSDIILLKVGDIVPCDSKIISGNIFVNESFLTGEANDVEKKEGSKLLAKSFVVNGTCYAEIIAISNTSYITRIQDKLRSFSRPKSQIIKFLNKIIFFDTILAFVINLARLIVFVKENGWNLTAEFIDSVTSSFLSMLSTGMYLMISIIITINIIDLYINHNTLINEPYSFETLSRSNFFCFDKTGTLTTGQMEVKELIPIGNYDLIFLKKIISQIVYLNKDENITAKAIKKYLPFETKNLIKKQYSNIPFNSKNKYSAISYDKNTYALGAFDFIKTTNNVEAKKIIVDYEKRGFRVLIVAKNNTEIFNREINGIFEIIGILVLRETIRTNVVKNLNDLKKDNIDFCIISGDSDIFLRAIAKKINFDNEVLCLKNLNIDEIKNAVQKYKIFARATPEQKKNIIDELKKQNKVVSMVGDGLNDLLALKSADCSIAISNGNNNITKSVSNIILFDLDFLNLKTIIEFSRKNIIKIKNTCIMFLIKIFFSLILNFVFFIFSTPFPYRVNNYFVWEGISIAIAPFFLSLEKNNKEKIVNDFGKSIIYKIVPAIVIQLINVLLIFIFNKRNFASFVSLSTISTAFMSLTFLVHTYYPLTKFRLLVFSFSFISIFLFFIIDFILSKFAVDFLNVNYSFLNKNNIFLLILFLNFLYFSLVKIWEFVIQKFSKK